MSEHDCGGWCEQESRAEVLALAREGMSNRKVAAATGIPYGTLATMLSRARRSGCLPVVDAPAIRKGPSTLRIYSTCSRCGDGFYAKRRGAAYCSPACGLAAREEGVTVYERHERAALGPAKPEFVVDNDAVYARALKAVRDGVLKCDLEERFGEGMARRAWEEVAKTDARDRRTLPSWYGDPGRLPLGLPA